MTALETQFPPLAQALGRLRQQRGWPYATRPAAAATPAAALPENDFLRMLPEPALTGDLPETNPAPAHAPLATAAKPAATRETLTAVEAIALAPLNRTYWFDL
jgi:hypothetical protein